MSQKPEGQCHICGTVGKLSYEHVPPQSAFNKSPIFVVKGPQLFEADNIDELARTKQQGGAGGYTLCGSCNNNTGGWYAKAYAEWAEQALTILLRAGGQPTLFYPFSIYPLRVIKQIITMFFSVNSPNFRKAHPYLEQFVLNKNLRNLPRDISIYVGYTLNGRSRSAGVTGLVDTNGGAAQTHIFSEIAFPPFVFVLSLNSVPPDESMIDISWFAGCDYMHVRKVDMRLPILNIYSPIPSDYRSVEEIDAARKSKSI